MLQFKPDIDLGNLVTILAFVLTLYRFHVSNIKRIQGIEFKVGLMWKQFAHKFDLPEDLEEAERKG